nr:tRNA pseudouridine(38-40) synthase TruA [bacterium]
MVSLENYKILLEIEYDGTDFCGWQIQPNARTIQGNLEGALKKLFCKEIRLHGSGRTDSGVHALRQIAHFNPGNTNLNPGQIEKGLNRFTDVDIFIHRVEKMPVDFHSRFS